MPVRGDGRVDPAVAVVGRPFLPTFVIASRSLTPCMVVRNVVRPSWPPGCCARRAPNHDRRAEQHQVCLLTPKTLMFLVYNLTYGCCSRALLMFMCVPLLCHPLPPRGAAMRSRRELSVLGIIVSGPLALSQDWISKSHKQRKLVDSEPCLMQAGKRWRKRR